MGAVCLAPLALSHLIHLSDFPLRAVCQVYLTPLLVEAHLALLLLWLAHLAPLGAIHPHLCLAC